MSYLSFPLSVTSLQVPASAIIRPQASLGVPASPVKELGASSSARSLAIAHSMAMDWSAPAPAAAASGASSASSALATAADAPAFFGPNRALKAAAHRCASLHFERALPEILDALGELTLALEATPVQENADADSDSSSIQGCDFSTDTDLPGAILAAARTQMRDAFAAPNVRHELGASLLTTWSLFLSSQSSLPS